MDILEIQETMVELEVWGIRVLEGGRYDIDGDCVGDSMEFMCTIK
jgi:hypothetical protein